jgi:hypothetical protein
MLIRDTRYNKQQNLQSRMLSKQSARKNDSGWKKDWKELGEEKILKDVLSGS